MLQGLSAKVLNRLFEIQEGKIVIDGVDIAELSLDVLRTRIAFVPQDTTLFQGTLRSNLSGPSPTFPIRSRTEIAFRDPQGLRTDAELITILKRAWLLPKDGPVDPVVEAKFSLDSVVGEEGLSHNSFDSNGLCLTPYRIKLQRRRETTSCLVSSSREEQSHYYFGKAIKQRLPNLGSYLNSNRMRLRVVWMPKQT